MKKAIIKITLICILLISNDIYSQEDKTVELTTTGTGITKDVAIHNALRSAIEQAFGVFISSKTEILNDELLTEQIIALSNGNIQQYDVISEIQINNNTEYAVSVKSKVSVSKLTSFIESKGIEIEFKGGVFAMNIKQQQLNEKSELKAIEEMTAVLKKISDNSFDFEVEPYGEPTVNIDNEQLWNIPLLIKVKLNSNFENYKNYFQKTLKAITMNDAEAQNYVDLKKPMYTVILRNSKKEIDTIVPLKNLENQINSLLSNPKNLIEIHDKSKYKDAVSYYECGWPYDGKRIIISKQLEDESSYSLKKMAKLSYKECDSIGIRLIGGFPLYEKYNLRNEKSSLAIQNLMLYFAHSLQNFILDDGLTKRKYSDLVNKYSFYKNQPNYLSEMKNASIATYDVFSPVILSSYDNSTHSSYSLSILKGNPFIGNRKDDLKSSLEINDRTPPYEIDLSEDFPRRLNGSYQYISVFPLTSAIVQDRYGIKPSEFYFPLLQKEFENGLMTEYNIAIQFNYLKDTKGVSTAYLYVDKKNIEDINKLKGYKIYPDK